MLGDWNYSRHYVDSAIKLAYSILKSWSRRYVKGEGRRKKPVVEKRFARIKRTLHSCRDGKSK